MSRPEPIIAQSPLAESCQRSPGGFWIEVGGWGKWLGLAGVGGRGARGEGSGEVSGGHPPYRSLPRMQLPWQLG